MQIAADFVLVLFQNIVFQNLLGLSPAAISVKNGRGLFRLGLLTMLFCTVSSGLTVCIRQLIPVQYQAYLYPLCNAVICGLLCMAGLPLVHFLPKIRQFVFPWIYYAAFSSAVLGTVLLSAEYTHDTAVAFRYGFRSGFGYFAVCVMLKMAAPLLFSECMPQAVRGWKGLLLYSAMLSMAAACLFP